jgi:hypothetical protein
MRFLSIRVIASLVALTTVMGGVLAADNPFLGGWELTIPGGAAGWLGVEEADVGLQARLLWGGGSVVLLQSAKLEMGKLILTRKLFSQHKDASGKNITVSSIETITATVDGDVINLTRIKPREDGQGEEKADFTGRREPPMPSAPDLSRGKFGKPIRLFDGKDLAGWRLTDPQALSGWSVKRRLGYVNI